MRNFLILLLITTAMLSCSNDNNNEQIDTENTIIGRWHLIGFEQTTMYQFTKDLRYTIYSGDGSFGTLDDAIPNPNTWSYVGDELVIDLNFGNFSITTPIFKCDGNVLDLVMTDGTTTLFREGYIFENCNE